MIYHLLLCTDILHFIRNLHRKLCSGRYLGVLIREKHAVFWSNRSMLSPKNHTFNTFHQIAKPTIAQSKPLSAYPSKRLKTAAELCPPKPNVLLKATFTSLSWASLKVRLIRLSISGSSLK